MKKKRVTSPFGQLIYPLGEPVHKSTIPVLLYFVTHLVAFGLLFLNHYGAGTFMLFASSALLILTLCVQTQRDLAVPAASPPVN